MSERTTYSSDEIKHMSQWGGLREEEVREAVRQPEKDIPEVLSGEEVARMASEMYEILGPELGCRLVEPNIVLTLAGLKGECDIPWLYHGPQERARLELLNSRLVPQSMRIQYNTRYPEEFINDGARFQNLVGYERWSRATNLAGIPPYNHNTGFDGLSGWYQEMTEQVETLKEQGRIPTFWDTQLLYQGIEHGYPDQAIMDYLELLSPPEVSWYEMTKQGKLQEADILSVSPDAKKIRGARPEFDYFPEHADDPGIKACIANSRKVLSEFYGSEWFKKLKEEPDFIRARERQREIEEQGRTAFQAKRRQEDKSSHT